MTTLWTLPLLFATFVCLVGCKPDYVKDTEEFGARVKTFVNPDELQSWATNIIAKTPLRGQKDVEIDRSSVPKSVRAIYGDDPEMVYVSSSGTDTCVRIWFGGGFAQSGHWGISAGPPSFQEKGNSNFYVIPWKPGLFFWSSD
jgi:hypothetical protein